MDMFASWNCPRGWSTRVLARVPDGCMRLRRVRSGGWCGLVEWRSWTGRFSTRGSCRSQPIPQRRQHSFIRGPGKVSANTEKEKQMRKFGRDPVVISGLSPEQYRVTQQGAIEAPGTGKNLHNEEPGIYVDIVSGEPLFASSDKYDS